MLANSFIGAGRRHTAEAKGGRLLRVLLIRFRAVPTNPTACGQLKSTFSDRMEPDLVADLRRNGCRPQVAHVLVCEPASTSPEHALALAAVSPRAEEIATPRVSVSPERSSMSQTTIRQRCIVDGCDLNSKITSLGDR
jgi:hypothetical protein